MTAAGKVVLFTGITSSSSWRVRICLALKNIPYESVWRDSSLSGPANDQNPIGQVPVLFIDGTWLTQSVAICEYLEDTRPTGLLPQDPIRRAQVREIVELINSGIQPLQNAPVLARIKDETERKKWAEEFINKGLTALEAAAKRHQSGDYFFAWSSAPTLAEAFLVPQITNARRYGVSVEQLYPRIARIANHLMDTNKAFSETKPPDPRSIIVTKSSKL